MYQNNLLEKQDNFILNSKDFSIDPSIFREREFSLSYV
jgi:hypothetical protein